MSKKSCPFWFNHYLVTTECPRSLKQLYILSYYAIGARLHGQAAYNWVKAAWTDSMQIGSRLLGHIVKKQHWTTYRVLEQPCERTARRTGRWTRWRRTLRCRTEPSCPVWKFQTLKANVISTWKRTELANILLKQMFLLGHNDDYRWSSKDYLLNRNMQILLVESKELWKNLP